MSGIDPRRVAHVLTRIGGLLELSGAGRFRSRAYLVAADAIRGLAVDDVTGMYRSGALAELAGVGPATLSVVGELVETGESAYLDQLLASVPEGLTQVARVPGLGPAKAALLHRELGVDSLDELEAAAKDGRLRTVRGFGEKTVRRVLRGIEVVRGRAGRMLFREGVAEAERCAAQVAAHPDVAKVEAAGEVRRISDVVREIVLVAECGGGASETLREIADGPGVVEATRQGHLMRLKLADDTELALSCAPRDEFTLALWRETGNGEHVAAVERVARELGFSFDGNRLLDARGARIAVESERELYEQLQLQYITPELREGLGEVEAAARGELPKLIARRDIRGVLHCHSEYSDGSVSIGAMAQAARERGWEYIGISDHSQAAFYAGGLKPDAIARQHAEIDELNSRDPAFTILKGIECDILAEGQLDYDDELRGRFDYVIGSIHSRFAMDRETMTARILRAMDDPHLTILAHPTGRLLLQREPYALDLEAVIEKAVETGVVLELNADPSRLDLDWRWCKRARERGAMIEIGPDAPLPERAGPYVLRRDAGAESLALSVGRSQLRHRRRHPRTRDPKHPQEITAD